MFSARFRSGLAVVVLATAGSPSPELRDELPSSRLSVLVDGYWREWWQSRRAPAHWTAPDERLTSAVRWRHVAEGVEWTDMQLGGSGEAWRLKVILVRLDPAKVTFSLDTAFTAGRARAAWSIDRLEDDVLFAVNAGQFPRVLPWGWVTIEGREFLAPGRGPLSLGVAFDSSGVRWIPGDSLMRPEVRRGAVAGFQSYPTLMVGGVVPAQLRSSGRGVDLEHRDARLAIGEDREGRILVALTRFDAVGSALDFVPFGLTVPEMAAVMGGLGAVDAVMLDGGISSQMFIRDAAESRRWSGLRRVPLGLVARSRGWTR